MEITDSTQRSFHNGVTVLTAALSKTHSKQFPFKQNINEEPVFV